MNQPILPGIRGSACRTVVAGDKAHAVTFSGRRGVFFTVTPKGELMRGPALANDHATEELADLLIDLFGTAYGSRLLKAEARALAAETHNRTLERKVKDAEDRTKVLENQIKRGMVDVLQQPNPRPNRSRWFGKKEQSPTVAEQLDALAKRDE